MFISQQTIETSFAKMKEITPTAKTGMERTTSFFRFLAFDMLCREEKKEMLDFSPDNSDMRNRLIENYDRLTKISMDSEVSNFGIIGTPGRFGAARIGNDFLTTQLKQNSLHKKNEGIGYPSRPVPILQIACGPKYWGVKKHPDWRLNIEKFLEGRSNKPFTYVAIYCLRSFNFSQVANRNPLEVITEGIKEIFSADLASFFNQKFQSENTLELPIECNWQKTLPSLEYLKTSSVNDADECNTDSVSSETEDLSNLLSKFQANVKNSKLYVTDVLGHRLASSLLSKRFLIVTGLAGSGKTKLAQAFARWFSKLEGCYEVVSVGADWTGNENILGYPNGLDKETYISKPALNLILHAEAHKDIPHFLILDEMNLSHVERYFADILSAIESDEKIHLHQGSERKANDIIIPADVELPSNLFIIGTVNVDETTYMFSPKVLDRANVIEFRMGADELENFLGDPAKPDLIDLNGKGALYGKAFVDAAKHQVTVPADVKAAYDAEMLLFFKMLQTHGAEFGYRTAYETARFIHFYKLLGNYADGNTDWFSGAFDCVVFQKLLPKLHGSRAKLGPVLKKLWFLCVNDAAGRGADALKAAEEAVRSTDKKAEPSVVIPTGAPYPLSAEKIGRMWRLLIENGFASFAEA